MTTTRAELHRLLDALPEETLDAARAALLRFTDPFLLMLANAAIDDEPKTDEERAAIAEARADIAAGRVRRWEDVCAEVSRG